MAGGAPPALGSDAAAALRLHRELNARPARRGRAVPRPRGEAAVKAEAGAGEEEEVKVRAVEWVGEGGQRRPFPLFPPPPSNPPGHPPRGCPSLQVPRRRGAGGGRGPGRTATPLVRTRRFWSSSASGFGGAVAGLAATSVAIASPARPP